MSDSDDENAPIPPIRNDSTRNYSIANKPLPRTPDEDESKKKNKSKQTKGIFIKFLFYS